MAMGLEGLNVLELGSGVAAAVATKVMADLGANVVKVEPPEGDGARRRGPFRGGKPDSEASGLFLALNPNKRSVALDLLTEAGQAGLEKLVRGADLLVHNFHPIEMEKLRIDFERFASLNPALVMVSITPFGLTGVHSRWVAADLTVMSAGGWGYVCPGPGTPAELPPIKPFGQHAWIQAGLHAAMVAMGALHGARMTGVGEHCDVSAQEVDTAHLGRTLVGWSYAERIETRTGPRLIGPMGFFRCKDGELFMVVIEEDQWERLKEAMGNPEWTKRPEFKTRELRGEHHGEIEELINAWMSAYTAEELFRNLQGRKLCAAPIFRYEQVVAQEQLLARGFVQQQHHPVAGELAMPGAPYLLQNRWWRLRTPAPRLGEANGELDRLFDGARPAAKGKRAGKPTGKTARPLEGIRVCDFSWVWAGPYCTMQLAHMGAEVIKIESAKRPEYARRLNIYPKGLEKRLNCSGYFNDLNQGKQSVTINLGNPEGVALVKQIAAKSDIVLSNFATGVMERLGLGAPELHKLKPDLIIGAISGFGQTGPCRNYTAYGPALVPVAGISYATGYGDGKAQEVGIAYGDPNAGVHMAYILLASLLARDRFGGGQYIDLSLWEAMTAAGFEGWINYALGNPAYRADGNHDPVNAPYNLYRVAGEDNWLSICIETEAQWQGLCRAMGNAALANEARFRNAANRKANEETLDAIVGAWCAGKDRWELTRLLQAQGVPAYPSLPNRDLVADPQLLSRDFFSRLNHAEVGVRLHQGPPWRFANRPNGARSPAPLIGADTDRVLGELLGLSGGELARLHQVGVLE